MRENASIAAAAGRQGSPVLGVLQKCKMYAQIDHRVAEQPPPRADSILYHLIITNQEEKQLYVMDIIIIGTVKIFIK